MRSPLAFFLVFFCVSLGASAQDYYAKPDSISRQAPVPEKVHFGMELGTGVSTNFKGGAAWSTFVSPYLSYRVSPRWTFNAGATLVNTNGTGFLYGGDARSAPVVNQQQTFLFAQGQYQASERLRLSGTSFYQLSNFNQPAGQRDFQFNSKGMSVYAEYKVSEHFSIGVGGQYSNGNNPYLYNGFGNGFGSGFGGSRFGRPGMYGGGW
jgi:hypothetical protein